MTTSNTHRGLRVGLLFAAMAQVLWPAQAVAQVASGPGATTPAGIVNGSLTQNGSGGPTFVTAPNTTTVVVGANRTLLNWNSFDVASGQTFNVVVASPTDLLVNRVVGGTASNVNGNVASYIGAVGGTVGGNVWLLNPNGIAVGSTGRFDVGGLLLSTAGLTDSDIFGSDANFSFSGGSASLTVANGAQLRARNGSLTLLGNQITTAGQYNATATNALIAARDATVTFDSSLNAITSYAVSTGSSGANALTVDTGSRFAGTRTVLQATGMSSGQGNVLLNNWGGATDIVFASGRVELVSRDADVVVRGQVETPSDLSITAGQNVDFSAAATGPRVQGNYSVTGDDFYGPSLMPTLLGANSSYSITDTAGGFTLGFTVVTPGDFTLRTTNGDLTVFSNVTSTNGDIELTAGGSGALNLHASLTTGTGSGRTITLAGLGGLIQSNGTITTHTLSASALGGAAILDQANAFRVGDITAAGTISARSDFAGVAFTNVASNYGFVTLTAQNGMRLAGATVQGRSGVELNGPIQLSGSNAVTTTNGGVTFNGTLDGDLNDLPTLTVTSTTGTTFAQDVGVTTALGLLTVNGASAFNGNFANVTGGYDLDAVTVGGSGGAFNFYGGGSFWADAVTSPGRSLGIQSVNGGIRATSISAGDFAGGIYRDVSLYGAGIEFGGGSAGTYTMQAAGSLDVHGALTTLRVSGDIGGDARFTHADNRINAIGNFAANGLTLRSVDGTIVDGLVDGRMFDVSIRGSDPGSAIQIDATGQIRGGNVDLSAGSFFNNSGADAIQAGGHWVVYQTMMNPFATYDGLDSGAHAIWGQTIDTLAPTSISGNRYVFAHRPTLTFTTLDTTKTYGTVLGGTPSSHYAISGYMPGVAGAYLGDTAASVFSGAPMVTSGGFAERATVAGGPYAISIANGSLASLSGYQFAFNGAGRVTVNPKGLTGTPTTTTKTYDGTTAATGMIALTGVVTGDTVGAGGTFTFVDKNAGTGKTVNLAGATLNGADAGNYTLTVPATTIGDILQKAITGTPTTTTKTYDGTANGSGTITLTGVVAGDTVGAGGTFTFVDKNAGTGKQVTLSGVTLSGADAGNYTLTVPSSLLGDILQKAISGTVSVNTKTYDGTTAGTGSVTLAGVVAGDSVSGAATFTFADKNAGAGKTVTVSGASLSGADAGNYTVTLPASALGEILRKALTGTPTVTAKTYDGSTAGTGSIALSGVVAGDAVTAGGTFTYADKNAGTGKTVTVSGATLAGADAGNYTLTVPASVLGDILQKAINGTALVDTKTYDGTTAATGTITLAGVVSGDSVGAGGALTFADKNAGAGKSVTVSGVTLNGADAGNYTISVPASAIGEILRRSITGTATVTSKTYDGTTAGTGSIALTGVVAGDAVGATGTYTFSDANAGAGKTVTVGGVSLSGADAGNYTLVVPGTTVADILRRAITVTANPASKEQGTTDPALGYGLTQGSMVAGDSLSGALARAPGEAPGSYAIGQGTLNASANYQLTFVGSTLTITAAPVDPIAGVDVTDDLGRVVRFLEGGGEPTAARARAALEIVDERSPCDPADREAGACETGRPD